MIPNPRGSVIEARIEVLCRVREMLRSGQERYICFALQMIRGDFPHLSWACDDISAYVKREIEGYCSLQVYICAKMFGVGDSWMKFPEPYKHDYYFNRGVMQMARLAWVDRMIEEETKNIAGT
jgi:hypothetical protein